ncbi:MAG TPA: hypothetical protein VJ775_01455 [Sphingomicrobium sp.]|nr:hypothetical protein [Sphingomicrobium sp.]
MNTAITLNIRKISNGYLVSSSGMALGGIGGDENYFATEGEMAEALPALATGALERAAAEMVEIDAQRQSAMAQQQATYRHAQSLANRLPGGIVGNGDIQRGGY